MTPNIEELDRLGAWVQGEYAKLVAGLPSEWDQSHWAVAPKSPPYNGASICGSACCLAGQAVRDAGGEFDYRFDTFAGGLYAITARMPDGRKVDIGDEASNLLGLSHYQADALFYPDNTADDIERIIEEIKDGESYPMYPEHPDYDDSRDDEDQDEDGW